MICAANGLPCFKDLIAVLLECFSIISLGYLSCRFKLVSSQAKDLNSYLTNLALPMIIFLNIAQMEFRTINLSFLLCVLAAKLLVFMTVTLLTLTISYPTNFGYAGSLSILATQSNDFALGYPLIKLLYGESRPEMLNYLSLMAPIQLLIINPLGIAMLEFQKNANKEVESCCADISPADLSTLANGREHSDRSTPGTGARHKSKLDLSFIKALATNPLILASMIALLVNLLHGPELPKYITRVSNTIAASFAAPALFVVGLSMYGKFELLLRNPRDLLLSSVMVLSKGLLLPSLVRTIALLVLPSFTPPEEVPYLVDFAFLYGLLPTAPTACIIAKQYGVLPNVVSISMLLSTIIAGPLTLASSVIISPNSVISVSDIENVITHTMETAAVLTLFLAPFTLYTFLRSRSATISYRNILRASGSAATNNIKRLLRADPIRVFVLLLALSQIMIGFGGLMWFFIDTGDLNANSHFHTSAPQLGSSQDAAGRLHNVVDLLDGASNESSTATTPVPQVLRQLHAGHMLSPRRSWLADHHMNLGFKTMSSLRYVFSAGGLMMAQFCILSLVLAIAATKLHNHATGRRVSELLLRACLSVLVSLVVWLIYDSEQLVHLPVEASLPSSAESLCVRLIYNVAILAICLPVFALVIRTDNRSREAERKRVNANVDDLTPGPLPELGASTFVKRRFVTSSASLSSDASSAATSNTNLDSTLSSGACVASSLVDSANNKAQTIVATPADSLSIIFSETHHIFGPNYASSLASSPVSMAGGGGGGGDNNNIIGASINNQNSKDLERSCDGEHRQPSPLSADCELDEREFNQYSILIVFMLINSTLNLFSVAQKLLHEEPVGTFRQIEVIGVALEFGQGLLTFLVYGTRGLSELVRCANTR